MGKPISKDLLPGQANTDLHSHPPPVPVENCVRVRHEGDQQLSDTELIHPDPGEDSEQSSGDPIHEPPEHGLQALPGGDHPPPLALAKSEIQTEPLTQMQQLFNMMNEQNKTVQNVISNLKQDLTETKILIQEHESDTKTRIKRLRAMMEDLSIRVDKFDNGLPGVDQQTPLPLAEDHQSIRNLFHLPLKCQKPTHLL